MDEKYSEVIKIGGVANTQSRSVYDKNGLCPTLMAGMDHGNTMPYIVEVIKIERDKSNRKDGSY